MENRMSAALDNLLVKKKGEIFTRIEKLSFRSEIAETKSLCYCYAIREDANNNLRLEDLVDFIDSHIIEYAIPKKKIDEAKHYLNETGSTYKIEELRKQARQLFTHLEKTGEGGELLLYILTLEVLKIPQLISKMSLKTSGQVHYQGSDGIHVDYDSKEKYLNLYWGESKMYKKISDGITQCFSSLNGFLLDPLKYKSTQERDLLLITENIGNNVNNPEIEDLLVAFFDKDSDQSNKLVYKGICFIGYDFKSYEQLNKTQTIAQIRTGIQKELNKHYSSISKKIKKYPKLDSKEIHIFLMPFPSVEKFRSYYLQKMK